MSEYFLKLDTNNYDDELDYMLDNDIFTFKDYKQMYENKTIDTEQFERIKEYYGVI